MEHTLDGTNTEDKSPVSGGQVRNANSRTIFSNARLTSQFLRNYTDLSIFSDVKPEDIEDVTDHYRAFLGIEFETDTVKKIRVTIDGKGQDVFVIPLIEHKSYVDYDVAMQILRYMSVIWYTYAKQQDGIQKNISHSKKFRYPLIIPIVYYEGINVWTADLHLKDRIENAQKLNGYVPDFTYYLVNCRDYTKEELESRHDEMSLIMLMNKIQNPGEYSEFFQNSKDYALSVYENAPEDIKQVYQDIIWALLMKMNVPVDEAQEMIAQLEVRGMGYLFENAEEMDIQAERQNTKEARAAAEAAKQRAIAAEQKAEAAEQKAEAAEQKVEVAEQKVEAAEQKTTAAIQQLQIMEHILELTVQDLIRHGQGSGSSKEEMLHILRTRYGLEEAEAQQKIKKYWI